MNNLVALLSLAKLIFFTNERHFRHFIRGLQQDGFIIAPDTLKRMRQGTIISAITNRWFSELRSFRPDADEQLAAIVVGAVTPVYDDLLDETGMTHDAVMQAKNDSSHPHFQQIKLFHHLMHSCFEKVHQKEMFGHYFTLVIESQKRSSMQESGQALDKETLLQLTADKGGYATLLYRQLLSNPMLTGEADAIYAMGHMLQYVNDLFGLWHDSQKQRQTLVTIDPEPERLRVTFLKHYNDVVDKFLALNYKPSKIHQFLRLMTLVASRAMVCVENYRNLKGANPTFEVSDFTRQQLVCDMEKPRNMRANIIWSQRLWNAHVHPKIKGKRTF